MTSNKKPARRERRAFSEEFKAEAVRMVAERRAAGATLTQVGRELDVRPDQRRDWARLPRDVSRVGDAVPGETVEQANRRLRRPRSSPHHGWPRRRPPAAGRRFCRRSLRSTRSRVRRVAGPCGSSPSSPRPR